MMLPNQCPKLFTQFSKLYFPNSCYGWNHAKRTEGNFSFVPGVNLFNNDFISVR